MSELEQALQENERLKARIKELESLAYLDNLTGLMNRAKLLQELAKEWNRAMRNQTSIALLFIDLNDFSTINNTKGHEAGDRALQQFGQVLRSIPLRSYDFAARYAGDEFIIVLPDASTDGARRVAEQVKIASNEICIGCAIGVAARIPLVGEEFQRLINDADKQMYADKGETKECLLLG